LKKAFVGVPIFFDILVKIQKQKNATLHIMMTQKELSAIS
jgi:hypothetical protein